MIARRYCDASFVECLKYLETIIKSTALKREDDTVTIMKEQKWSLADNAEQIQAAQKDCQAAQRRDDLTMSPFQGPIGKYPRASPEISLTREKKERKVNDRYRKRIHPTRVVFFFLFLFLELRQLSIHSRYERSTTKIHIERKIYGSGGAIRLLGNGRIKRECTV